MIGSDSILTAEVQTPIGYYAAGLPVIVMARTKSGVLVCMDNGHHPTQLCHCMRISASKVRPTRLAKIA